MVSMDDAVTVSAPATSSVPLCSGRSSGRSLRQNAYTAAPIGRLMRNTQCQLSRLVSTPPASTPTLPPPAQTKPNTPIALARSPGSLKRLMMSESAIADTTAPPAPWIARALTSMPCEPARPQASEAASAR